MNKSKSYNHLMLKIKKAINDNKVYLPLEITKSEGGLVFKRVQEGNNLLGIIDVPLNFDVFGKTFKVKVL